MRIEDCHKKGRISWNPDAEAKKKIHGVRKKMRCTWPVHLALSPCLNGNGEGHWGMASRLSSIDFGHQTSMKFLRRTSRPVASWSCWRGLWPFFLMMMMMMMMMMMPFSSKIFMYRHVQAIRGRQELCKHEHLSRSYLRQGLEYTPFATPRHAGKALRGHAIVVLMMCFK